MKLGLTFAGLFLGFVTTVAQEPIPSLRQPEKLILDLDHPRFRDRDSAYQELARMGDKAVPALRNALVKPGSAEARDRILQTFGPLPAGKLTEPSEGPIIPRAFEP